MDIREITSKLKKTKIYGDGWMACCPAHNDKTPSLSLKQTKDGHILLHCFAGCSLDSILSALQISESDLFPQTTTQFPEQSQILTDTYLYESESGTPLFEVCRYEPKTFRIRRIANGKTLWGLGDIKPVLYCLPEVKTAITAKQDIYLCEGEKDCNRLRSIGLIATTSPMGAGKWRKEYTDSLLGAAQVILLPDNDEPGRRHAVQIAKALKTAEIPCAVKALWLMNPNLPEHGDVSDFLDIHSPEKLLEAPDMPLFGTEDNTLAQYLKNVFERDRTQFTSAPPLKTGFPSLDAMLYNRLSPGLYLLGAISSLGKSAFCGQLCDTFAAQGQKVLFFSLEMPVFEMAARSLTRTLFITDAQRYANLHTGQILCGEISDTELDTALVSFLPAAQNITYIEGNFNLGVQDIRRYCENACAEGTAPVVFIDYLQVLKPPETRLTDKQAIDQNVVELKRISRDCNVPIFVISSLNRQNYNDELNFTAFKESGAIEYSADFVMGLQAQGIADAVADLSSDEKKSARQIARYIKTAKNQIPRPLEAVVLKNRRGQAQGVFSLRYWPAQNYFEEY